MKVLIIDDEHHCTENLSHLLKKNCKKIEFIKTANSTSEAERILENYQPDILFLDIEMPGKNGFQLLKTIDTSRMAIIFVTAHDKYALQAIKCGPTGYVLKPIVKEELVFAIKQSVVQLKFKLNSKEIYEEALNNMTESLEHQKPINKICLSHTSKLQVVDLKDIIFLSSDNNYTNFYLKNDSKILITKTLKYYQTALGHQFIRVHRSYLINVNHIKQFNHKKNEILMSNDQTIIVSRRKSNEVMNHLKKIGS